MVVIPVICIRKKGKGRKRTKPSVELLPRGVTETQSEMQSEVLVKEDVILSTIPPSRPIPPPPSRPIPPPPSRPIPHPPSPNVVNTQYKETEISNTNTTNFEVPVVETSGLASPYQSANANANESEQIPSESTSNTPVLSVNSKNFIISFHDIERVKNLGSGNFGEVWMGMWRHQKVAVKQLKAA